MSCFDDESYVLGDGIRLIKIVSQFVERLKKIVIKKILIKKIVIMEKDHDNWKRLW